MNAGDPFWLFAISDGYYQYTTATTNGSLRAYREVAEPTYEEYRKVFERDSRFPELWADHRDHTPGHAHVYRAGGFQELYRTDARDDSRQRHAHR